MKVVSYNGWQISRDSKRPFRIRLDRRYSTVFRGTTGFLKYIASIMKVVHIVLLNLSIILVFLLFCVHIWPWEIFLCKSPMIITFIGRPMHLIV